MSIFKRIDPSLFFIIVIKTDLSLLNYCKHALKILTNEQGVGCVDAPQRNAQSKLKFIITDGLSNISDENAR